MTTMEKATAITATAEALKVADGMLANGNMSYSEVADLVYAMFFEKN